MRAFRARFVGSVGDGARAFAQTQRSGHFRRTTAPLRSGHRGAVASPNVASARARACVRHAGTSRPE